MGLIGLLHISQCLFVGCWLLVLVTGIARCDQLPQSRLTLQAGLSLIKVYIETSTRPPNLKQRD